jgi:hypothetical protein
MERQYWQHGLRRRVLCLKPWTQVHFSTEREWPSRICSNRPVIASQNRTVLSADPDITCLLSGEKSVELTEPGWSSSVCGAALQSFCTFGFLWTYGWISCLNCLLTILLSGAKTRAEEYIWRGTCSIRNPLNKASRFISLDKCIYIRAFTNLGSDKSITFW